LFVSYLAVVAVGLLTSYLMVRLLAPTLFEHRMADGEPHVPGMGWGPDQGAGQGPGQGQGMGPGRGLRAAFVSALNAALLLGTAASTLLAGAVAVLVTRGVVRPLRAVREATRRIAAGRYDTRVAPPGEPELAALAGDVNTLARALADTETRRIRLLGDLAHEMRTPLTVLDGYVEGIIDGVFPADPPTLAALAEELRRLHRLAEDLSALSRIQEGALALRLTPLDLADLVRRTAGRLAPQFADAGVDLEVVGQETAGRGVGQETAGPDTGTGPVAPVVGDGDRLAQVLTNLLGNALVATPSGGRVVVRVLPDGDPVEVTVTDTGVGLAEGETERVFDRFHRAAGAIRRSSGSGIGLTIARDIARAHGGELAARSPGPGRGATFTLRLPRRPDRG
jgi:histidine kinase